MTGSGNILFFLKDSGGFVALRPSNPSEHFHFNSEADLQALSNQIQDLLRDLSEARRAHTLAQEENKIVLPTPDTETQ